MDAAFQVDKFHFNNQLASDILGDYYSGFSVADQTEVFCLHLNTEILSEEQVAEMQRVSLILAQREHENVLRPLAWGTHEGRPYLVLPAFGKSLDSYEGLKRLPPAELLLILKALLRALCFAEGQAVEHHLSIRFDTIRLSLEDSSLKLGLFGYPTLSLEEELAASEDGPRLMRLLPPPELADVREQPFSVDLYSLGLIMFELATAQPCEDILSHEERLSSDALRERLNEQDFLPLPLQELIYRLLTPVGEERYESFQQALEDVLKLTQENESGISFRTFVLDTLINGRFRLGEEIASGRISRVYHAVDLRQQEEQANKPAKSSLEDEEPEGAAGTCCVKLIDLKEHPELAGAFHTRFKQLTSLKHDHLMEVYDVGIHFENGYIAMESGLISLEDLLIKRGTLPLTDAGRITFQLCKALEALNFSHVAYHGMIRPANVFLSTDLRTVKLADALTADFFLRNGNLNLASAEYFNPEYINEQEADGRSDIYGLGLLFFEMLAGHPPFSFKIEQELIEDHLHLDASSRIEPALVNLDAKQIIQRMLEKNPSARYQNVQELKEELASLLGYDKREDVRIPHLLFDFAELSMVGKNAREKSEETLAVRLPAVNNRGRGVIALLVGHGKEVGDAAKASSSALRILRELIFNPGSTSRELAAIQKQDPEAYLNMVLEQLNLRLYREAFGMGKTNIYGLSALIGIIQENTLYLHQVGEAEYRVFRMGEVVDLSNDKWTIIDEQQLGNAEAALSPEPMEKLGFGELFGVKRLKRRLKDGDQMLFVSKALDKSLSISELRELITSASEPSQAMDLIRGDAVRRRLEGTISCVLLSIGDMQAFANEEVSHAKKGMLARNFLAQGDHYLNDNRIEEAVEQYTKALEINPNFAIIHHQLGLAYVRKGLFSYAQSCFQRALDLNGKLAASYVEIAKLMIQDKRHREVLPLLRTAVMEGCRDADLYAMLGRELLRARSYEQAVIYCSHALELNPGHPTAFRDRINAIKRRNALDTKVIKIFAARPRLADDERGSIEDEEEGQLFEVAGE